MSADIKEHLDKQDEEMLYGEDETTMELLADGKKIASAKAFKIKAIKDKKEERMIKKGIEGRVEITIEKVGKYFIVDIEDVLGSSEFFESDYMPKKKVCFDKQSMIIFIKTELNLYFE